MLRILNEKHTAGATAVHVKEKSGDFKTFFSTLISQVTKKEKNSLAFAHQQISRHRA